MYKNRRYQKPKGQAVNQNIQKPIPEDVECSPVKTRKRTDVEQVEIHEKENDDLLSSQASIPASQPPTQRRYLSQRSLMLCKTQSKTLSRAPNSYFEMVLMKAGADLDQENVIVLAYDNVTFVNRLYNLLNKNQDNPNATDNFVEGLQEYLNDKIKAIKLLTGCSINIKSSDTCVQSQDSIIINILMVEMLQKKVIEILLDKIEEIAENKSVNGDISLLPLLLSQLRLIASTYVEMLYDRIVKIFEKATQPAKNEIILNVEFVLDPMKHDDFVNYLLENYTKNEDLLNKSTVQMFTNFSLSSRIQTKIKKKILQYIKDECDMSLLPSFIKFLLTSTGEDDNNLTELITDLRNCLHQKCCDLKNENNLQLEIFDYISQALIRSRKIYDNWLKIIQNIKENNIKSIDFIILLILISIREEKSNFIENLIRRWIKQESIKVNIIIETKNNYSIILESHKDLLFRILHDFLREKNPLLFNFAKQAYRILFTAGENYQKKVLRKLVELICDKSMSSTTSITLEILRNLQEKYAKELQNCGLLLLPLLDRLNEMNLNEFRTVLEILCSISYPQPPLEECQILKDHIDMLVKKQIISQANLIKKQGIIGTVQLVYHISCTEIPNVDNEDIYDLDNTYNSIDELPEGRGKLAANYITRVFSSTSYCIESLALFYNEMANVFSLRNKRKSNIDRHFLVWLCDLITNYFQNYFIVEDVPQGFSIKLAYKNCINTASDKSDSESEVPPIAINISGPILKPSAEAASSIIILPPLFNLMRVLHFIRYNKSLVSINAVLGCAVILPESIDNLIEKYINEDYNEDMTKKILDIHFHLINWYREIIGSFSSQNEPMIRKKILLRLNELIKLEDTVQDLLLHPSATNYTPPPHQFIITSDNNGGSPIFKKPIGKPKKALNTQKQSQSQKKVGNQSINIDTEDIFPKTQNQNQKLKHKITSTKNLNNLFRQMDLNIMLILREKLIIKFPLSNEEIGDCIGLSEFKFILSDLVDKLESITGTKKTMSFELLQYIKNPRDLIDDIIHFLPIIMDHFKKFTEKISSTVESVNGALGNADLFTNEFNYIKICHGLCLRLLSAIFSWSEFEDESNEILLNAALCTINDTPVQLQEDNMMTNLNELSEKAFNNFIKLDNSIVDLKSAVYLFNLCSSLKKFANNNDDLEKSLRNLCRILLCKKWYSYMGGQEKGAACNILINELLGGLFKKCDLKKLKGIIKVLLDEVKLLQKKDNVLKTFPNINKANFPMVFKYLCSTLITVLGENLQKEVSIINTWEEACEVLNSLLTIVKSLDVPRNFLLFLKYAHIFLKIFIQNGLPVFEKSLRRNPERVSEFLKSLQVTTRFLHNLCCHSKAIKQASVVAQIPFVRETIENLVFKVKAALAANKCSSVFWMGDLKNKDLHGDVILSQGSYEEENNDDEEELPDNDEDDDEINESVILDQLEGSSKKSLSQSDSI